MIIKQRENALLLDQLEALERRLPAHHDMMQAVQKDLRVRKSGRRGEKEIEFPLRFLNEHEYLILHNVRLQDQSGFFQMDTLLLCEKFILILEVKNWSGTIFFGQNGQVTRIHPEQSEEGFPNPISQARLQQHRLQKWLNNHGWSFLPIDFFVVISFPSTMIKSTSPENPIPEKVVHNSQLFFQIQVLEQQYETAQVQMDQLLQLAKQLAEAHVAESGHVMERHRIFADELITGVICPECGVVPMGRRAQKWFCITCSHVSADAHLSALHDYRLLIGDRITNREARNFLQVASPYVVKYILQKEGFSHFGNTSARTYVIPELNGLIPE